MSDDDLISALAPMATASYLFLHHLHIYAFCRRKPVVLEIIRVLIMTYFGWCKNIKRARYDFMVEWILTVYRSFESCYM